MGENRCGRLSGRLHLGTYSVIPCRLHIERAWNNPKPYQPPFMFISAPPSICRGRVVGSSSAYRLNVAFSRPQELATAVWFILAATLCPQVDYVRPTLPAWPCSEEIIIRAMAMDGQYPRSVRHLSSLEFGKPGAAGSQCLSLC